MAFMLTFSAYLIKLLLISFHNKCRTHKSSSKICILVHAAKCRVFSHDVTAAILVSQNNETAAVLASQTSPVGVEHFAYVNAFFCSNKFV